jgi:hypothetical protein
VRYYMQRKILLGNKERVELIESTGQMCYTFYAKYGIQKEGG